MLSFDQSLLFALLGVVFAALVWGRVRYDVIAFGALVVAVLAGVVPRDQAFSGFGHPATVIVALVLVVSRGLAASGAIELIGRRLLDRSRGLAAHIGLMSAVSGGLSAVMNNVATLALLMPLDMQAAKQAGRSPALTLMPLSFASILGGMVTLIGTPPNIVIATFREQQFGEAYGMFDFTPVGLAVAVVGVLFVALLGWRLLPAERQSSDAGAELMEIEGYVAELGVGEDAAAVGQRLRELYPLADECDVSVLGIIRDGTRLRGAARNETVRAGDRLVVQGGPEAIEQFIGSAGLEYLGTGDGAPLAGETLKLLEVVVPEASRMDGRSAGGLRLAYTQGVMLVGVSRQGQRFREQVRRLVIRPGDILLLLGPEERLGAVTAWLGCLPLADRGLQVVQRGKAMQAIALFALAVLLASLGLVYLPVALAAVVVAFLLLRIVPLNQVYDAIEWPVIVLLGSLIPIGTALEASGGTALIAESIVSFTHGWPAVWVLVAVMVMTMTLSDLLNNVATALIAAPIAVEVAARIGAAPDPFLMAVAVAASCAFLTPIGHKNNTIVMGPGGYRFGDYWRMGLPLELLVLLVSVPTILLVWPL